VWERLAQPRIIFAGLALAVLVFYWQPLFNSDASIQWDAVDVTYSPQKLLSEMLHAGKLPFWTPYAFSGMPLLADPQLGAWYPPNWPFLLVGVTPRAIEWQLALHALLAALGAYLLARDLIQSRAGAVFAGVFYAFSGLFAETSSHVGPFQASAWLPLLLWTGRRGAHSARWLPAVALAAGSLVSIGHFQTALYSLFALGIFLAADFAMERDSWLRSLAALGCAAIAAVTMPAVMVLPGLELSAQSVRAGADYSRDAGAALVPGALAGLVIPDHYGALDAGQYNGPQDITQFYLYMGILMLPLAIAGAAVGPRQRWYAVALVVPGAWYAFGPPGGFYSVIAVLPGFRSVRAPIQMWFVAALGLALLAGIGAGYLRARRPSPWIPLTLLVFTAGDLYYWNMSRNPLTYAREPFEDRYGAAQERFKAVVAPFTREPMHRIYSPVDSAAFGPLNGTLDSRIEVTYGYNPLQLSRYSSYIAAATTNPKLLNGLSVTAIIDAAKGSLQSNPGALPRLYAPDTVSAAASSTQAAARLATLDPAHEAVAEGIAPIARNGGASVRITVYEGDFYRSRVETPHDALVRIAVPYFPGWRAEIDGLDAKIVPVDLALMGVVIPAGSHDLVVRYQSTWFRTGLAISVAGWLAAIGGLVWAVRGRKA
jgi:hypothetical protein